MLDTVREIRTSDPGIGGYKLWVMLTALLGADSMPGRDSFYALLRRNHLMLPPRRTKCTTNSNHRFHKWKNLIKGFEPTASNQLWVSDITYIPLAEGGWSYLHLVTDAYSRKIVGWMVSDSLGAANTIEALQQAIRQAVEMKGDEDLSGLVHHSDRGIQYCCDPYVALLQKHHIAISMTEDYKPTDNAIAERVNGTIKTELVYRNCSLHDVEYAKHIIGKFVNFYNSKRPHMSVGYKVPDEVHLEEGKQKKKWKTPKYTSTKKENEKENLYLQGQTDNQGEDLCQRS